MPNRIGYNHIMDAINVRKWTRDEQTERELSLHGFLQERHLIGVRFNPRWLTILRDGLQHQTYVLEATRNGSLVGVLPLSLVKSALFGRFLVSLPYINVAGIAAVDEAAATALIDRSVELADRWDVRYLELRNSSSFAHPALTQQLTSKVLMQLPLPSSIEEQWKQLTPKVRNQIRKGEKQGFTIHWGSFNLLDDFYEVFSHNMRDLGTPVFGRRMFRQVLANLPDRAELCTLRLRDQPIAAALLIHEESTTQVPSASSLRAFNSTNANMLLYWQLLGRAINRGQRTFDFGRSGVNSNTYRFKKQWGASAHPTVWQYYVRKGSIRDMRPDGGKYSLMIRIWRRLPVSVTRVLGPMIVRGIP